MKSNLIKIFFIYLFINKLFLFDHKKKTRYVVIVLKYKLFNIIIDEY